MAAPTLPDGARMPVARVLMVCVGNVCRSPMAAALWRDRFRDRGVLVESTGLAALTGHAIDPHVEMVLAEHGLSAKPHVARQITASLVNAADLVLVMEHDHMAAVQALSPHAIGRTFLLGRWSDAVEIPDPHRRPWPAYVRAYRMIERAVDDWRAHLDDAPR